MRRPAGAAWLLCTLLAGTPLPASAQTLVGRVLEERRETAVGGAVVSLIDRQGRERLQVLADSAGRFVLVPPEAGEYVLQAVRLGYETTRSPLLALTVEGRTTLDLMMVPLPIGLEGLTVEVEAAANAMLRPFGLSTQQLRNRWIDRADIDAVAVKQDPAHVIQWQNIAGVFVARPESSVAGSDDMGLCVSFKRGRSGAGADRCAVTVLDGQIVPGPVAMMLDPDALEGMAVLTPVEATTLYGELGGAGAVLLWTRRGSAR